MFRITIAFSCDGEGGRVVIVGGERVRRWFSKEVMMTYMCKTNNNIFTRCTSADDSVWGFTVINVTEQTREPVKVT